MFSISEEDLCLEYIQNSLKSVRKKTIGNKSDGGTLGNISWDNDR